MSLSPEFLQRYLFDWEVTEVIIGGQSAIDTARGLQIRTPDDVTRFLECYGYDLENPIEKAELFGNFQEALSFVRRFFLQPDNPEGLKLEIPRKIAELTDVSQLLVMASALAETPGHQPQTALWACAIIKIMHTIAHMDKDLRSHYFTAVQTQILDRFYKFIHSDEKGQVFLGKDARDGDRVDLVSFDSKPKKSRDSLILKLLHKPENVAEDIFDRVGIRFVTKNRFDALRVVKFLKDRYVIMSANIKPSRSRNSLLDTKEFLTYLKKLLSDVDSGKLAPNEIDGRISEFFEKLNHESKENQNPHSSQHFRSMQFTGRQLIKFKNPLYDELKALKSATQSTPTPEKISRIIERLDLGNIQKEIRFFYPFEVQVFDEVNFIESQAGRSSHSNYKKSQIQTALRRVMGPLLRLSPTPAAQNASN